MSTVAAAPPAPAPRSERVDRWWVQPLLVVLVLAAFSVYALWAALQNANYYAAPYLSPFYSPCLTTNCAHVTLPLIGAWWNLSPAFLILGVPLGFRATCYYYRKAYYRSFFWSPPACAVPDARRGLQRRDEVPVHPPEHSPLLLLAVVRRAGLPVVGRVMAFRFPNGFGMGLGTLVLLANAALLSALLVLLPLVPLPVRAAISTRLRRSADPLLPVAHRANA